jgi:hypothetical protein
LAPAAIGSAIIDGISEVHYTLGFTMTESTTAALEPPTLARLNALLAAGYRIDHSTSQKVRDAVWLDHPAKKRVQEPTLILYPTGLVVSDAAKDPTRKQLRFDPNQELEFGRFVKAVPLPSFWERSADVRINVIAWAIFLGIVAIIWAVLSTVLAMVGKK